MRRLIVSGSVFILALALASCSKTEGPGPQADIGGPVQTQASDLHPCKVTGTQLTVEDCEAAQYWLDKSTAGTAAFSGPTRMLQGQTRLVTLAIGTAPPPAAKKVAPPEPDAATASASAAASTPATAGVKPEATGESAVPVPRPVPPPPAPVETPHQKAIQAVGTTNSQTIDYYPFVGRQMAADLEGEGFDIKPMSPRVQPVNDGAVTTWEWQVTARKYGKRKLVMKTTVVMIDSQGKAVPLKPTTEFKEVTVWIWFDGILETLKSWPDWLKTITAILAGLAALIGAFTTLRKLLRPK